MLISNSLHKMKEKWALTQNAFDNLLTWLDPDLETAGAKYETIRRGLISLFTCRGCPESEKLADEVIDRVAKKLPALAESYSGNPDNYFYGVAQNVHLEYLRTSTSTEQLSSSSIVAPPAEDKELEHNCLENCLKRLSPQNRTLILQYYQEEKRAKIDRRGLLARQLGIELNSLRIKAHRIRASLYECVVECMNGQSPGRKLKYRDQK